MVAFITVGQSKVDSLSQLLESSISDSDRFGVLYELTMINQETDIDAAAQYAFRALSMIDSNERSEINARLHGVIVTISNKQFDFDKSIKYGFQGLNICNALDLKKEAAELYSAVGNALGNKRRLKEGVACMDSALAIYTELNDEVGTASILASLCAFYNYMGDYPKAAEFGERSLRLAETMRDSNLIAHASQNLGVVYLSIRDLEHAEQSFIQSLRMSEIRNDTSAYLSLFENLALVYYLGGKQEKALDYFQKTLDEIDEKHSSSPSIAGVYINMANIYMDQSDFTAASQAYKNAERIMKDINDHPYKAAILIGRGAINARQSKYSDAARYFEKALAIGKEKNYASVVERTLKRLPEVYEKQGKYKKSLELFKEFIAVRDTMINENNISKIMTTRLEARFAKEQMADSLKHVQEMQISKLELNKKKKEQVFAFIGFILLISLLGALYRAYRNQTRASKIIAQEKAEAETQKLRAEQSESRLQALDAVKTRIYNNITHEFRTPLTIIQGVAQQLIDAPQKASADGLHMIVRNSESLISLVNQMLDLSKLESGGITVYNVQDDIYTYIKYLIESIQSLSETKKIDIVLSSPYEEIVMDFDPEKIKQIVFNLLSNAIKFTPELGRIEVDIDVVNSSDLLTQNKFLQITVDDNGVGIAKDKLPYIFDRFYQVDDSPTRTNQGTGIGLALVKELVRLKGGEITASSVKGQGATFVVNLPITNEASKNIEGKDAFYYADRRPMSSIVGLSNEERNDRVAGDEVLPRLLLVEDNDDVIAYLTSLLRDEYTILIGKDGEAGIDLAIEHIPDLVITDVMMPLKDGYEVCQTLKQDLRTSHIPIIMLTAKADMDSKLEGLQLGADDYLAKPFNKEELFIRIQNLLTTRKKLQQYYAATISEYSQGIEESDVEMSTAEHQFLMKLQEIAHAHVADASFTTGQFCLEIGMSQSQLQRKLKALTDLSPNRYIRQIRLQRAKKLLMDQSINISQVAYDIGFNDPSYFSRAFKKEFGMSPMEWRETVSIG